MSSPKEITNWRERPKEPQTRPEVNKIIPEFRGSPNVYKTRYAPTRDEPYGNREEIPRGNHNPRFNERPSSQPMQQSASLRRHEFLNTSPIKKVDPSQNPVEGNVQNFLHQFTSNQQQQPVLQPQQQQQQQSNFHLQGGGGNGNQRQFTQQPTPNLQPQFQQQQPIQQPQRNGNNQNAGVVQQQQQIQNLLPQFQQRGGNNQNAGMVQHQQPQYQQHNGGVVSQQLIPPQIRTPILQQQHHFQQINGIVPQPLMQLVIPNLPASQQFNGNKQKPKQDNRNKNSQQQQQRVEHNPRQQNVNQKSEQPKFSGLTESSGTKYRDQRIKQMAAMNKNEVPNSQQNHPRPNKQNQKPHQQREQQPQNKGRKQQSRQQPETKPVLAEPITKDWIIQPIIPNEVLIQKFGTDDPKCHQLQKNPVNTSAAFRNKRIQHNSNKNSLEESYKKMSSESSLSLEKTSLPRIPTPEVKYYPKKTFVTFRPKNRSHVLLTSAVSMNTIFIRSFKMNHDYCSVIKGFNEMENSGVPFMKIPEVNGMVLTKYKNLFMRAHVTKAFQDHVEVFFTDLGFRENKKLSELKNINILRHTSVTYIHQYRLKNIPEKSEKSEEVLKYLKNLYERNFELITDDTGKECDLIDYQTDESVCSRILSILGIEMPEVVEVQVKSGEESCDDELYGTGTSANIEENLVDHSSEGLSFLCENLINEESNSSEVSFEKNDETDEAKFNLNQSNSSEGFSFLSENVSNSSDEVSLEETYEAKPNHETEDEIIEKDEDVIDLPEETIQKLKIPEMEDAEVEKELETEDGEIEDEHPREVNQEQEQEESLNDQVDESNEQPKLSKIIEGKNITVVVTDKCELRDGSLSIMNEFDFKTLKKLQEEIQSFCEQNTTKSYKPSVKEICLAKNSNGKWYRATCLKYLSDTATVVSFIDLGNLSKVYNIDLKKCPKELNKPCFSVSCFIEDLDEVTPELESRLNQLIPLDKLIVDEIKYVQVSDDEEICVIELKNVVRILREEGLMF